MHQIDIAIVQFVNSLAGKWPFLDRLLLEIFHMNSFKMMPLVAVLAGLWFVGQNDAERHRKVFCGFLGGVLALVVTRVIQNLFPYGPRPAFSAEFDFVLPGRLSANDWSSFPSDTAALAIAIATAILLISRPLGFLAFFWAIVVVSFRRLYAGYHYPSDLLIGGLIGAACVLLLVKVRPISNPLGRLADWAANRQPALFYTLAFIVTFQVGTYFVDVRQTGERAVAFLFGHEDAPPCPPRGQWEMRNCVYLDSDLEALMQSAPKKGPDPAADDSN